MLNYLKKAMKTAIFHLIIILVRDEPETCLWLQSFDYKQECV